MKSLSAFDRLRCKSLARILGLSLLFAVQGSLSAKSAPRVSVGREWFSRADDGLLQSEKLAECLMRVEAEKDSFPTALTEKFMLELQAKVHPHDWKKPIRIRGKARIWEVSFNVQTMDEQGNPEWAPSLFDRLIPASFVKHNGYEGIIKGDGAGAPFVLAFEDIEELRGQRAFRPSNGLYVAGTVLLDFGKAKATADPKPVRCRIINTFSPQKAKHEKSRLDLAYNVTAVVEMNLDNPYIRKNGLAGLLRPGDRMENDTGLFGITAFHPKKTPVVFIHGLDSGPHIWRNAVNEIYRDPELNERYVPLLFMYPSGLPVPAAAERLRKSIQQYRDLWDPKHGSKGFDNMILVGHSMGGLLTRLQVIDSGDEMWKAFFLVPASELPWLSDEDQKHLESSLKFKPLPCVKRAVFVAVPHKGSRVADSGIVRLAVRLIRLPVETASYAAQALTDDLSLLNPALLRFHSLGLRSVDMLSPEHPFFDAISRCALTTPCHSIIGDRGKPKGENSTDGIVPYWSSHLPMATSEKVAPFGHSCTLKSQTVNEITRILRLHAAIR